MVDKVKSVDISALFALYPRNLKKIGETEDEKEKGSGAKVIAEGLKETDLSYDEKTKQLKVKPSQRHTSFEEEETYIHSIRKADTKVGEGEKEGEKRIDLDEAKTILARHPNLPFSAESYLDHLQKLMERRYNPLAENMKKLRGRYAFDGAIDAMRTYNDGLLVEEKRLAKGQFKSVVKTLGNVGLTTVIPANEAVWAWDHWISSAPGADERKFFLLDRQATSHAEKNFKDREDAIKKFEDFLNEALKKKETWALAGEFEAAKKKFGESQPKAMEILKTQLVFEEFQRIYSITDQAEFYRALMAFADKEDHGGFLTIGGGNSTQRGFYNFSGVVNNYAFRRAVYSFINDTAQLPDKDELELLQRDAELRLDETLGDGGDFFRWSLWAVDSAFTGVWNFLPGEDRQQNFSDLRFTDEDASDSPARVANFALLFSSLRFGREAVGLRGLKGTEEFWTVLRQKDPGVWGTIKYPKTVIRNLRQERLAELRRLGQDGALPHPKMSRYTRWQWNFPVSRGIRKVREGTRGLGTAIADKFNWTARTREYAGKAAHGLGAGSGYLIELVMILGVMDYLDKDWNPKARAQNYKHDLDLHVLADPTQPDPQFYGPGDLPWLEGPKAGDDSPKK